MKDKIRVRKMFQDVQSRGVFSSLNLNIRQFYVKLHYGALGTVLGNTFTSFIGYYEVAHETGDSFNRTVP